MPDPVLVALRRKLPIWEGAGLTDLAEATKARIAEFESASEPEPTESESEPESASPEPPPRSGPGSGRESWVRYAEDLGYQVTDDMTRDDIFELVEGD